MHLLPRPGTEPLRALAPSTTAGYGAVASLRNVPLTTVAPAGASRSMPAASTAMLPVCPAGILSFR